MDKSKEILSTNIKNLLKIHGYSREDCAKALNVKYTTFCDWAKGRTYPKMEYINMLAEFFGVKSYALTEESPNYEKAYMEVFQEDFNTEEFITIYEYSDKIGNSGNLVPSYTMNMPSYWTFDEKTNYGHFGLILNDDTMNPEYNKGDKVIVLCMNKILSNGFYIIKKKMKNDNFKIYFRKIKILDNQIAIIPINSDNEIQDITHYVPTNEFYEKYEVVGKLRMHIKDISLQ